MPVPTNDKPRAYSRYAAHCLHLVIATKDEESRSILREMAAEWVRLADALSEPPNGKVYKLRAAMREANSEAAE